MNVYNRFYAWLQKRWRDEAVYPPTDAFKKRYLPNIRGTVLEIGPGAGSNFRYLPKDIHWIGVEPNRSVVRELSAEAQALGMSHIEIHNGVAENLPLPSGSCDAVVATFVLCSVKDQAKVLSEIMRVLKPGGKYVFIEHVAAKRGGMLRFYQDILNPFNRLWAGNCHLNRETLTAIRAAGFQDTAIEEENIKMTILPWPHIRGVGSKPSA